MARKTTKATPVNNKTVTRGRMFVALLQIQQSYPGLRLGQAIANATFDSDLFNISDEDLVKALENYTAGHSHSQAAANESRG